MVELWGGYILLRHLAKDSHPRVVGYVAADAAEVAGEVADLVVLLLIWRQHVLAVQGLQDVGQLGILVGQVGN